MYDDQQRQDAREAEDRAALIEQVDSGAKNKLKNSAVTQTVGEVVYTVNPDGTVSAYTTATTTATRTLTITSTGDNCYVYAGDLITGNPDTALDVAMQYGIGSSGNIANYTPSEEYHVITVSGYVRYCLITIRSGVSIPQSSPLVFKPMICTAADWAVSQKFVPYAPTNRELYENKSDKPEFVSSISSALDSQTDGTICGYVGSSSTIPNVSAEYIVARTYTTDNSLDRRIQIVESSGGARETRYYNGTSWGSWTPSGASTQSVQPTLMSAAKPMIDANELSEKGVESDEVSEIEEKENVKDEPETA